MQNTYHFISGLPRTGSTLLSAILSQNPAVYAGKLGGLSAHVGYTTKLL